VFILAPLDLRGGNRYSREDKVSRPEGPSAGCGVFGEGHLVGLGKRCKLGGAPAEIEFDAFSHIF